MSVEGVAQLRADIAASAARTRSLRAAARKMGGRSGMLMLQRTDDAQDQRARYIALALLTGRRSHPADYNLRTGLMLGHEPELRATREAARIVASIAGESFPGVSGARALDFVRHWARNDYAVGDICKASEGIARRLEGAQLKAAVERTGRLVGVARERLEAAQKRHTSALVARVRHDAKYPLTPAAQASTVAAQLEVT